MTQRSFLGETRYLAIAIAIAVSFIFVEPVNAFAAPTSNGGLVSEAISAIGRFSSNRSLSEIQTAIKSLSSFDNRAESKTSCTATRRRVIGAWGRLIMTIQSAVDPKWDPNDESQMPLTTVDVPGNQGYLPGIDPSEISDPKIRHDYQQAIDANDAKANRLNYQAALRNLRREAMVRTNVALRNVDDTCPDDRSTLESILRQAGLRSDQIRSFGSPQ